MSPLTCLMAASLPGPLGGQLAGAQGRGVSDGLPPVLRGRGARVLRAGAVALQPPGTRGGRTQGAYKGHGTPRTLRTPRTHAWQAGESCRAGRQQPSAIPSCLAQPGGPWGDRPRGGRGGKTQVVPYLRRCASWQLQCQAFLESVRVSSLSKGKLRGSWVSRLFSR